MADNPLLQLQTLGQSVWLDYIDRGFIARGELAQLIRNDGLSGVTTNPAIFEQAISSHHDYDADLAVLAREGLSAEQLCERLTIADVRAGADALSGTCSTSEGRDGFVSLEVAPHLARDTQGSLAEARRLWSAVDRPNLMIKIPGTREGLPAVRQLIAEGINVNITLLFSVKRYREVADAYLAGLEDRVQAGLPVDRIASVASFFISRIDTLVDQHLGAQDDPAARGLRGEAAVACAQFAYQEFKDLFAGSRWRALADRGARPQRLLWASTSTKNPDYTDTKYVDELIAPLTVTTLPAETLAAFRDHGEVTASCDRDMGLMHAVMEQLRSHGIDLDQVAVQLEEEGIRKFAEAAERLHRTVAGRIEALG